MSPLSPGTKENVQLNMKKFGQPSVKRDYTNSFEWHIVNPFLLGEASKICEVVTKSLRSSYEVVTKSCASCYRTSSKRDGCRHHATGGIFSARG